MKKPTHSTGNPAAGSGPQVCYSNDGRGGTIHYVSPEASFDMWFELAMPPALIIMGIPGAKHWQFNTNTPLAQRDAILGFIGNQIINDKLLGNGYFLFDDQTMSICSGKNPNAI